jgi:hypothetical protein
MDFLVDGWREPDDGIWEVRGPRRHFTHSKVMAWVAIDRAIKTAEEHELERTGRRVEEGPQGDPRPGLRRGVQRPKGSFTQYYGSDELDASLLMIPLVGFLPANDPRVRGTIEAVERELVEGGFVLRYRTVDTGDVDGLSGREGAFLACSFWLADCFTLLGRTHDARQLLDRLMGLRNDLGLLSEEYDPVAGRLVGNFPQAFSHVSLVNSASKLAGETKPTSDHLIFGLARRAVTQSKVTGRERHMSGAATQGMLSKLIERVKPDDSGSTARAIKAAVQSSAASAASNASITAGTGTKKGNGTGKGGKTKGKAAAKTTRRARPTTAPSDKQPAVMEDTAPLPAAARAGRALRAKTKTKAPTKRAKTKAPTKRAKTKAPAKRAPAKRAPAKRAPARKSADDTVKKSATKKTATKKTATKKTAAKKTAAKQTAKRR